MNELLFEKEKKIRNILDSEDQQNSTRLPTRSGPPKKMFVFLSFVLAILGTVMWCGNPSSYLTEGGKFRKSANFLQLQQTLVGQQPVKPNCANLYAQDYHQFPDSEAVVICNDLQLTTASLKADIVPSRRLKPSLAIGYIETGNTV